MKNTFFVTLVIGALYFTLLSNNTGVATNQGKDRTGSPVGLSQQCGQCHSGGAFSPSITLTVYDASNNPVTSYDPGQSYTYEVKLASSVTTAKFGFQTVSLIASNNDNAGTLTAQSSNAKIVPLNNRSYGEHTAKSSTGIFMMTWTAPAAGSGDVKFYAAGIACNGNGGTSGDNAITSPALTLTENGVSFVAENENNSLKIFPNPSSNILFVESPVDGNVNVEIFRLDGTLAFNAIYLTQKGNKIMIEPGNLVQGIYIMKLSSANNNLNFAQKLIRN